MAATLTGVPQPEAGLPATTTGIGNYRALNPSGDSVLANQIFVNVKDFGATGDGAIDDTSAVNAAKTALRSAGGGTLFFPRGMYLIDSFDWDYFPGGSGKLVLLGEGSATIIKKRADDGATFFKVGRSDTAHTFQGSISLRDFALEGINGGTERVLDLWGLTNCIIQGVRVRYGANAIVMNNCVTNTLIGCIAALSGTGLLFIQHVFGDASYSDPNLNTLIGGAYKDNADWAIHIQNGTQIVLEGTQIENNGTTSDNNTGGILVDSNAAYLSGVNRLGRALTMRGGWFESNKGRAAVVLKAGSSLFEGVHWPNNSDATRELYNDGGKYTLLEVTMAIGRVGGNIEDTANAKVGNLVLGSEIATLAGSIDETKTTIIGCNAGTGASPNRVTRYKGRAGIYADSTNDLVRIRGIDNQASGSTVSFGVTFASAPDVTCQTRGADDTRIFQGRPSSITTTGFVINKLSLTTGSSTISTTSDTVQWEAIGTLA